MKYAVISDIHGNLAALEAVLEDAQRAGVDEFIFLGDYCLSSPFPNEVANIIKAMPYSHIVRGNEEDYFDNILPQEEKVWINSQYSTLYWGYNALTKDNLNYLNKLPEELNIPALNTFIRAFHCPERYFEGTKILELTNKNYLRLYCENAFTHEEYIAAIKNKLSGDEELRQALNKIPDGIYTFGHTHVQWHIQIDNKLFINPGSCGLPLDCKPGASYTIIDISTSSWKVTERRVQYDIDKAVDNLLKSELYKKARVMSSIVIDELRTGFSQIHTFFEFIGAYADEIKDTVYPYTQKTWTSAYEIWKTKRQDYMF